TSANTATRRTVRTSNDGALAKLSVLDAALAQAPGSAARSVAVQPAARDALVSSRTIYRWLDRYEQNGIRGLGRVCPATAALPRIAVSRPFDRAFGEAGLPEEGLLAIAPDRDQALQ